jgi:hypothetical protein
LVSTRDPDWSNELLVLVPGVKNDSGDYFKVIWGITWS